MVFWGNEVILLLSLCYCWSSQPELPQVVALISLPWNKRTPNSSKSNSSNLSHKKGGSFPPFTQKHKHDRSANSAKDMLYNKCLPGDQHVRRAIVRLRLFLPLPCAWASYLNEGELLEIHVSHRVMYFAFYLFILQVAELYCALYQVGGAVASGLTALLPEKAPASCSSCSRVLPLGHLLLLL